MYSFVISRISLEDLQSFYNNPICLFAHRVCVFSILGNSLVSFTSYYINSLHFLLSWQHLQVQRQHLHLFPQKYESVLKRKSLYFVHSFFYHDTWEEDGKWGFVNQSDFLFLWILLVPWAHSREISSTQFTLRCVGKGECRGSHLAVDLSLLGTPSWNPTFWPAGAAEVTVSSSSAAPTCPCVLGMSSVWGAGGFRVVGIAFAFLCLRFRSRPGKMFGRISRIIYRRSWLPHMAKK